MATNTTKISVSKPSFATIAAMAPPSHSGPRIVGQENQRPPAMSPSPTRLSKPSVAESPSASQLHRELQQSMTRLAVKDAPLVVNVLNDQQKTNISRAGLRFDDDQTHGSSSSTKPASVDGKSTTSGTTFALDEKESLRPDDSASVNAAEDEDFGSGPASGAPNSRVGSEAGSRAFRDQFYEITENIGSSPHRVDPLGRRAIPGIEEEGPQTTHAPLGPTITAPASLPTAQFLPPMGPTISIEYKEPDEKLFEALASPKDRIFLLRLEQEVITFVKDSTPTPLSSFVPKTPPAVDNTPASLPAMKIMRRAGLGKAGQIVDSGASTADASTVPSGAGSETGDDSHQGTGVASPTDSNVAKDKAAMTREEREAKYKETRERIFGPESENVESSEAVNELSRTSSRNDKKKKKHKNQDDGFEARSQFTACYPTMQYPVTTFDQSVGAPAYHSPYAIQPGASMNQAGTMGSNMFAQGYQQPYQTISPTGQGISTSVNANQTFVGYDLQNNPVYTQTQQMPSQYYPQMQQGFGMGQQSSTMSSPGLSSSGQFPRLQSQLSDQQWQQNGYSYPYQQSRDQQQYYTPQIQASTATPDVQPYPYGQLPMQGMPGAKSQHPLPGSYKSQSFNPQTRAFVPNGGSNSSQMAYQGTSSNQPMSRSPAMSSQNGFQYSAYGQPTPTYPQMASMPVPSTYNFGQESKHHGPRKSSSQAHAARSPVPSSLSKWGTPAHLPPKPPPPEAPSFPEGQHSLPTNNHFNAAVHTTNGGQPMPSFQNGVYSMPGATPQTT
ncbi:hypothetical protein P7C71_g5010, partial [Lecanoromycetidae sp. Uapishka_2]